MLRAPRCEWPPAGLFAELGDTRGIAELERAIGGEQEEIVQSRLLEDLGILRNKIRQ